MEKQEQNSTYFNNISSLYQFVRQWQYEADCQKPDKLLGDRLIVPNYPHHIIQRGHNRQVVFASDEDYLYYLENLRDWKEKLGCQVYGIKGTELFI